MSYIQKNYAILNIDANTSFETNNYIDCDCVVVDTTATAITVTLQSNPSDGCYFIIKDSGNASVNNITIDGNGKLIDTTATKTININYDKLKIFFCIINDKWFIE